jgi:hypothetical protein
MGSCATRLSYPHLFALNVYVANIDREIEGILVQLTGLSPGGGFSRGATYTAGSANTYDIWVKYTKL